MPSKLPASKASGLATGCLDYFSAIQSQNAASSVTRNRRINQTASANAPSATQPGPGRKPSASAQARRESARRPATHHAKRRLRQHAPKRGSHRLGLFQSLLLLTAPGRPAGQLESLGPERRQNADHARATHARSAGLNRKLDPSGRKGRPARLQHAVLTSLPSHKRRKDHEPTTFIRLQGIGAIPHLCTFRQLPDPRLGLARLLHAHQRRNRRRIARAPAPRALRGCRAHPTSRAQTYPSSQLIARLPQSHHAVMRVHRRVCRIWRPPVE